MNDENEEYEKLIADAQAISEVLLSDLPEIGNGPSYTAPQSIRRHYCRALFAWIGGYLESLKRMFLFDQWLLVDETTEQRLRGRRPVRSSGGKTHYKRSYLPLVDDAKKTFSAIADAQDIEPIVANDDPGWDKLRKATRIRNRVVHPKRVSDLTISDAELALLQQSALWFIENATLVLTKNTLAWLRQIRRMQLGILRRAKTQSK